MGTVTLEERRIALPEAVHAAVAEASMGLYPNEIARMKGPHEVAEEVLERSSMTFPQLQLEQRCPLSRHQFVPLPIPLPTVHADELAHNVAVEKPKCVFIRPRVGMVERAGVPVSKGPVAARKASR